MIVTDWMSPTTGVLGRLSDYRAGQYWDKQHLLARKMSADARDPQPKEDCCVSNGILWDLAALYPAGVQWNDSLPPAVFFNGNVVDQRGALEKALRP